MKKLEKWRWGAAVQFLIVLGVVVVLLNRHEPGEALYNDLLLLMVAMPVIWLLIAAVVLLTLKPEERFAPAPENRRFDDFIGATFMAGLTSWLFIFMYSHSKAIITGSDVVLWTLVYLFAVAILKAVYHIQTGVMRKRRMEERSF